jgi:predicted nucleic acid-binding Zn ribbon protein
VRRAERPRAIASTLRDLKGRAAPATPLAAVQLLWPEIAGPTIAQEGTPVAERDGTVTIACRSSVWAQELDLMAPELLGRLNARLEKPVEALRFTADAARHEPRP